MPCSPDKEERRRRGAAEEHKNKIGGRDSKGAENVRRTFHLRLQFGSFVPGRDRLLLDDSGCSCDMVFFDMYGNIPVPGPRPQ